MLHTIRTSVWINIKNLRFFLLQYLMLVILFPCSYLLIGLVSSGSTQPTEVYSIGLFASMILSLFLNMQASLIANSNSIAAMEQYATFKVRPLFVHIGGCFYHTIVSLPFFLVMLVVNLGAGTKVQVLLLTVAMVLSLLFLSATSMVLGGLFRNPNVASPLINMLYMLIVMLTPLYADPQGLSSATKVFYCLNPFAHITSLLGGSFGLPVLCAPYISATILLVLTVLFGVLSAKRWYSGYATEKLSIF